MTSSRRRGHDVSTSHHTPQGITRQSDAELVVQLQHGSPSALNALFARHSQSVATVCQSRRGSTPEVDEVVVDVFVALWLDPRSFDPANGSLSSFLQRRASAASLERTHPGGGQPSTPTPVPPERAEPNRSDPDRDVRRAFADLPEMERRAVELALFERLTHRTIADRLNVADAEATLLLRTGLTRLRGVLGRRPGTSPPRRHAR